MNALPSKPMLRHLHVLNLRRIQILLFTIALLVVVGVANSLVPATYTSTALVEVTTQDQATIDIGSLEQVGDKKWEVWRHYQTQNKVMRKRVVLNLALAVLSDNPALLKALGDNPIRSLYRGSQVSPIESTHLFQVQFSHTDPEVAAACANAIAEGYRRFTILRVNDASRLARKHLEAISNDSSESKRALMRDIAKARTSAGLLSEASVEELSLASLRSVHRELSLAYISASTRSKTILELKQSHSIDALTMVLADSDPVILASRRTLQERRAHLARLKARYLDEHPLVQQMEAELLAGEKHLSGLVSETVSADKARTVQLKAELEVVTGQISTLLDQVAEVEQARTEIDVLIWELKRVEAIAKETDQRSAEMSLLSILPADNVYTIERAIRATAPSKPRVFQALFMSLILGLVGGALLALFSERLESPIRSRFDVEQHLGFPYVGQISEHSSVEEGAIELLAAQLWVVKSKSTLAVTSTHHKEGKSHLARSLAEVAAVTLQGKTVLIEGDVRRWTGQQMPLADERPGLLDVLLGHAELEDALIWHREAGYYLLSARTKAVAEKIDLAMTEQNWARLLSDLKDFDRIVVDVPPIGVAPETMLVCSKMNLALFVVAAGATSLNDARTALTHLHDGIGDTIGVVLNFK